MSLNGHLGANSHGLIGRRPISVVNGLKILQDVTAQTSRHFALNFENGLEKSIGQPHANGKAKASVQYPVQPSLVTGDYYSEHYASAGTQSTQTLDEMFAALHKAITGAKQVAQRNDVAPAMVTKAASLSSYNFALFCDDSEVMKKKDARIMTLEATVRGLHMATRLLNKRTQFSLNASEGPKLKNLRTEEDMENALKNFKYHTGARPSGLLRERVLDPLIQQAKEGYLRPTVVIMFTAGDIGDVNSFAKDITRFENQLDLLGYDASTVPFLIHRIGSEGSTYTSLTNLMNNPAIKNTIFCPKDSLNTRFGRFRDNKDAYVDTILQDVIRAADVKTKNLRNTYWD